MTERRDYIALALNHAHERCVMYKDQVWKGRDPKGESELKRLNDETVKLREYFLNGAPEEVRPEDAQRIMDLVVEFEVTAKRASPKLAEDIQHMANEISEIVFSLGVDPSGPHGEYRFRK